MKKILLIKLFTAFSFISFAQTPEDSVLVKQELITKSKTSGRYVVGDKKIKKLKPYLASFPESAGEYRKYKNSSTATVISMGVCIGGLTTALITKSTNTRKAASIYVNIPALISMGYFGIKSNHHLRKSISFYNRNIAL